MILPRRAALLGLSSAFTLGRAALALAHAPTEKRFIVVILRGGLDGMTAVVPYGDGALTGLRAAVTPPPPGHEGGVLELGGFYGLHPAMKEMHRMYAAGEMLVVHAVAAPYRTRSHFEAQDLLEVGADLRSGSGWLNRAVGALWPARGSAEQTAIAIGVTVPLLLRGAIRVASWGPSNFRPPPPELYQQVTALAEADPAIGPALREGMREHGFLSEALGPRNLPHDDRDFEKLAGAAGQVLGTAGGPRVAALELDGFDSHGGQLVMLDGRLRRLDSGLAALRAGLGQTWRETAVLVISEFGRTARSNGTNGTDHGTAGVAFVVGGAVAGGRVIADWPGLGPGRLFENRDLAPTTNLHSVTKGLLAQHLGADQAVLAAAFPESQTVSPAAGLIRA